MEAPTSLSHLRKKMCASRPRPYPSKITTRPTPWSSRGGDFHITVRRTAVVVVVIYLGLHSYVGIITEVICSEEDRAPPSATDRPRTHAQATPAPHISPRVLGEIIAANTRPTASGEGVKRCPPGDGSLAPREAGKASNPRETRDFPTFLETFPTRGHPCTNIQHLKLLHTRQYRYSNCNYPRCWSRTTWI